MTNTMIGIIFMQLAFAVATFKLLGFAGLFGSLIGSAFFWSFLK